MLQERPGSQPPPVAEQSPSHLPFPVRRPRQVKRDLQWERHHHEPPPYEPATDRPMSPRPSHSRLHRHRKYSLRRLPSSPIPLPHVHRRSRRYQIRDGRYVLLVFLLEAWEFPEGDLSGADAAFCRDRELDE